MEISYKSLVQLFQMLSLLRVSAKIVSYTRTIGFHQPKIKQQRGVEKFMLF